MEVWRIYSYVNHSFWRDILQYNGSWCLNCYYRNFLSVLEGKMEVKFNFCRIYRSVVYHIRNWCAYCRQPQLILLVYPTKKAQKGWYGFPVSSNLGITWWWLFNATPWPLYSRDRDPVPRAGLYKCRKSHPHRLVASRYTDCTIPPHLPLFPWFQKPELSRIQYI
jgi:hypothetical protein